MRVTKFRVQNFRSVRDSGWIEMDDVTALIGTNESGKTNLLLPLWKFNPAKGGEIDSVADLPRHRYSDLRDAESPHEFVTVHLALEPDEVAKLSELSGHGTEEVGECEIGRRFNGNFEIRFPLLKDFGPIDTRDVVEAVDRLVGADGSNEELKRLRDELEQLHESDGVDTQTEARMKPLFAVVERLPEGSGEEILSKWEASRLKLQNRRISSSTPAGKWLIEHLPKFVYYAHYGNLDAEIYLPHVIQNLKREKDLRGRNAAQVRTIRVLFEFLNLDPSEIYSLGQVRTQNGTVPSHEVERTARETKEREILLQSASSALTKSFREWWQQGTHKFRFQADGHHFRVWVADDQRPEEIELPGRSAGLQWFFSFFLVFLVEAQGAHSNAVLLLDEPGLSLHPHSQRDLSLFFDRLSKDNQLVYTTHSPFMVDPDGLHRVRAVYVDDNGYTVASSDLRAGLREKAKKTSVYAVHAALGLSISDTLLLGCQLVVVEGPSDQHYLSAIKTALVADGSLKPERELVFAPAGGVRGIRAVASVMSAGAGELPVVVLDSDESARGLKKKLENGLYKDCRSKLVSVDEFDGTSNAELEDLLPYELMEQEVSKLVRGPEVDFDEYQSNASNFVAKVEGYANDQGIELTQGWKVDLAKRVKRRLIKKPSLLGETKEVWEKFFARLLGKPSGN